MTTEHIIMAMSLENVLYCLLFSIYCHIDKKLLQHEILYTYKHMF